MPANAASAAAAVAAANSDTPPPFAPGLPAFAPGLPPRLGAGIVGVASPLGGNDSGPAGVLNPEAPNPEALNPEALNAVALSPRLCRPL